MNTFILYWNPRISNYKDEERSAFVMELKWEAEYKFNWAVWDWQLAHKGDRFFRIRCGMPNPADDGIIDSGYFISDPYVGDDWSGKGRVVHYAEMRFDVMIDFNDFPILPSNKLDLRIPHFDWHGGHSGRILDPESAQLLEDLWLNHLKDNGAYDESEMSVYTSDKLNDKYMFE